MNNIKTVQQHCALLFDFVYIYFFFLLRVSLFLSLGTMRSSVLVRMLSASLFFIFIFESFNCEYVNFLVTISMPGE